MPSALTDDQAARIQDAQAALRAAERALAAAERRARDDIADAHPDDPPPGQRLRGEDRGVQSELEALTGYSASHLRAVRTAVRNERRERGAPVRRRARPGARARLEKAYGAGEDDDQGEIAALRDGVTAAREALADAVEAAHPYGGPDLIRSGPRNNSARLMQDLTDLTGRPRWHINAMRRDAAQRREAAGRHQAATTPHDET